MSDKLIISPVGRFVQGDVFSPNNTNMQGGPLVDKSGNPKVEYFVRLAIPKGPEWDKFWGEVYQAGAADMPQHINNPTFSWKIIDGDTAVDTKGKPYREREGWAGCWVIKASSGYAPQVVDQNANNINDPNMVKRGYYARIGVTVQGNKENLKPGVYINLQFFQFIAYGEELRGGMDVAAALQGHAVGALPPGASTTPVAGAAPVPSTGGAPAAPGATTGGPPSAPGMAPPAAPSAPAPAPAPAAPAVSDAAPGYRMTAKAGGASYLAFRGQGWTDEAMVAQGYMEPAGAAAPSAPGMTPPPAPAHGFVQ